MDIAIPSVVPYPLGCSCLGGTTEIDSTSARSFSGTGSSPSGSAPNAACTAAASPVASRPATSGTTSRLCRRSQPVIRSGSPPGRSWTTTSRCCPADAIPRCIARHPCRPRYQSIRAPCHRRVTTLSLFVAGALLPGRPPDEPADIPGRFVWVTGGAVPRRVCRPGSGRGCGGRGRSGGWCAGRRGRGRLGRLAAARRGTAPRWRRRAGRCAAWSARPRRCRRRLPAGARVTGRLRRHVATRIGEGLPVSVAGAGLLGWPAAHAAFVAAVVGQLPDPEPVEVLGIDETRRGRPRWTRAEDGEGWVRLETFETNFVDLAGGQGLLGQASGRTRANVLAWLDERGQAWKDAVQVVAMDPCATYRAAVAQALPHATIVADHFYLVRLANQALTDVRRRVTWATHGRRGRAADPEWAQRRRLLRG